MQKKKIHKLPNIYKVYYIFSQMFVVLAEGSLLVQGLTDLLLPVL